MQSYGEDHANNVFAALAAARPLGSATPFDRTEWFTRLASATGFAEKSVRLASGSADGVTAYLPLVQTAPGQWSALANWYSFVVRPLFNGSPDVVTAEAAFTDLARQLRSKAAQVSLYPVPDREGSSRLCCNALRAAGWWVIATRAGDSHWLDLAELDHASWWESRPGALRNTIARKAKKGVVGIQLLDHFDADVWAAYEAIYAASWKPEEGDPALLRAFAEAEATRGQLRLGLARIAGEPVAAQFWTVEDGTAFIHKLAHVEDSVKASPGSLLTAALFRHVIEQDGVKRVDFGTGNDKYKRDWMNRHHGLWRIEAFNPARPTAWLPALKARVRQARAARTQEDQGDE